MPDSIKAGRLDFAMSGERLKGTLTLVRMKGKGEARWLFLKNDGEFIECHAKSP